MEKGDLLQEVEDLNYQDEFRFIIRKHLISLAKNIDKTKKEEVKGELEGIIKAIDKVNDK